MDISAVSSIELQMLNRLNKNSAIASNPFNTTAVNSETFVGNASKLEFGSTLKTIFDNVDARQKTAEQKATEVELGLSDDLIGATVASQKAQLSFSALMQVRNKMVTNFNDIIKMSI